MEGAPPMIKLVDASRLVSNYVVNLPTQLVLRNITAGPVSVLSHASTR